MTATHLAYPHLAINRFCGTDPDHDTEYFIQLIQQKNNFARRNAPGDAGDVANYTFRNKTLFSSLLQGPAAEWLGCQISSLKFWYDKFSVFFDRLLN